MTDIVERLRGFIWSEMLLPMLKEAADEIERLHSLKPSEPTSYSVIRAATIEECAQIISRHPASGSLAQGLRRDLVAAIRALKEQK